MITQQYASQILSEMGITEQRIGTSAGLYAYYKHPYILVMLPELPDYGIRVDFWDENWCGIELFETYSGTCIQSRTCTSANDLKRVVNLLRLLAIVFEVQLSEKTYAIGER